MSLTVSLQPKERVCLLTEADLHAVALSVFILLVIRGRHYYGIFRSVVNFPFNPTSCQCKAPGYVRRQSECGDLTRSALLCQLKGVRLEAGPVYRFTLTLSFVGYDTSFKKTKKKKISAFQSCGPSRLDLVVTIVTVLLPPSLPCTLLIKALNISQSTKTVRIEAGYYDVEAVFFLGGRLI